jgi:VWFA-related protein
MKKSLSTLMALLIAIGLVTAQNPQRPAQQQEDIGPDDVVRITTELVQTDVVVVDSKERVVTDLTLDDFELYENGKKQDLKFMEFVSVEGEHRVEGKAPVVAAARPKIETGIDNGPTAKDVKRVVSFVIDDLNIPIQDLPSIRNMLLDFVNNKMRDGDLVSIVRVVGGKGLLQQFTSDKQLLRTAIAAIKFSPHPFRTPDSPEVQKVENPMNPQGTEGFADDLVDTPDIYSPNDEINQAIRGLSALSTAVYIIESLKEVPGRKNLVIVSGGIPIFQPGSSGGVYTNVTYLLNQLSDRAVRAGVVINALDPRGLRATPGVTSYTLTPTRSAIDVRGPSIGFGRGGVADMEVFGPMLAGGAEHLGLSTVAATTGGVSVVNTNNFEAGLDKILSRSTGYYVLAYTPREKFDKKFHKFEVKVRRDGLKVLHHAGYTAREEKPRELKTKEEQIVSAARSPLAKREIDVTPNVAVKLSETNIATVDVHLLIDARKLNFVEKDGRHAVSFDIVGFVLDELGKQRQGFSETVNLNLTDQNYETAIREGLVYSATTELDPGFYQVRAVVRESSGAIGTFSKYLEIPDLKKQRLAMSSLFLFAVTGSQNPVPLTAARVLSRSQDLRYAAVMYNAKGSKPQLRSQLIISQNGNVLMRGPEEAIPAERSGPVPLIGQFGVGKMKPGRYVLTLTVTDTQADKKNQTLSRSLDFTVLP